MECDVSFTLRTICDSKLHTVGYQLLFHNPDVDEGPNAHIPESLTTDNVSQVFAEESLAPLLEEGMVFVNFSESMLSSPIGFRLPTANVIITLHDKHLTYSPAVMAVVVENRNAGYKIAINYRSDLPNLDNILKQADIITIDVKKFSEAELTALTNRLKGLNVQLFAKGIDTHAYFNICQTLGFHYFEGKFLISPNLEKKGKVASDRLITMRLLVELDNEKTTIKRVEELLSQDSRLSYRLLREVNSAYYSLPRAVHSIREAVIMLGLSQIRKRATMVLLSSVEDKPPHIMLTTLLRAKMCELIGEAKRARDPNVYFTAGLFSTLDALLDRNMSDLIQELKLADDLKDALLGYKGKIGSALQNVICYTENHWAELSDPDIDPEMWRNIYIESIVWANTSYHQMH